MFKDMIKAYLGDAWIKILIFAAIPFVWIASTFVGGLFNIIMSLVMFGAYFVIFGMGVYDDLQSNMASSGLAGYVNNIEKKIRR